MILEIKDNFDLDKIIDSGQCFRAKRLEDRQYVFISKNKVLHIKKISNCKYDANWDDYWLNYFDLNFNYSCVKIDDDFLNLAATYSKGIRILKQDPFETLISFIISQRKSIPAIKTSIERICQGFGDKIEKDIFAFPTPKQLSRANLENCGLGYRHNYVKVAATNVFTGDIDLDNIKNLSTYDLLNYLIKIYGVGKKIANCVALFAYGRYQCAPIDTWINKLIKKQYNGHNPFDNYKDYAGIIQQYVFYYILNNKDAFK